MHVVWNEWNFYPKFLIALPLNNHWKAISYSARVDIRWLRLDYCVATLSRAVSHKSRLSQTAKSLRGCVCTGCVRRWSNFCVRTLRPEIAQDAIVVRHVEGNGIVLRRSLHPFRALDNENRKNWVFSNENESSIEYSRKSLVLRPISFCTDHAILNM